MGQDRVIEMLKAKTRQVSEEEYEAKTEKFRGYDYMVESAPDGSFLTWEPKEKAKETPRPLLFKDRVERPDEWESWIAQPRLRGKRWILFGAGSSALDLPLSLLDGEIVVGINWTQKWFDPTFLQILDTDVMQTEVCEKEVWRQGESPTQLVTSTRCAVDAIGHLKNQYGSLNFHVHHSTQKGHQHDILFAEKPDERLSWYSNSLGYALNWASWFKPRRIVLVGFDFGGAHFFGDGRAAGSRCHYGLTGSLKPHLLDKLADVRDQVQARGIPIHQVGATQLELFHRVETLEEGLYR